jgi:hypothetical protein
MTHLSEETNLKGRKHVSFGMLGKHHSQESKAKISAAKLGKKRTEWEKRRMSLGRRLARKKRAQEAESSQVDQTELNLMTFAS